MSEIAQDKHQIKADINQLVLGPEVKCRDSSSKENKEGISNTCFHAMLDESLNSS